MNVNTITEKSMRATNLMREGFGIENNSKSPDS